MKPPTENEVQEALAILRRDYYADVRGLADAWREIRDYSAKHDDAFDPHDALRGLIDGHERVIYTYKAKLGLLCSDNEDAYEENFGERPQSPESAMAEALYTDVLEVLNEEFNHES